MHAKAQSLKLHVFKRPKVFVTRIGSHDFNKPTERRTAKSFSSTPAALRKPLCIHYVRVLRVTYKTDYRNWKAYKNDERARARVCVCMCVGLARDENNAIRINRCSTCARLKRSEKEIYEKLRLPEKTITIVRINSIGTPSVPVLPGAKIKRIRLAGKRLRSVFRFSFSRHVYLLVVTHCCIIIT